MVRRPRPLSEPKAEVERLKVLLDWFLLQQDTSNLREQVRSLVPAFHGLRALGSGLIPAAVASSARDKIISYLQRYPLVLIDGDELLVISGIGEWARRVRELRVQFGWAILSGLAFREMAEADPETSAEIASTLGIDPQKIKPDQYVLVSVNQDRDAAHRWNVLNTIRKKKLSVKAKIIEYMRLNVGARISIEELKYLANSKSEWARRVRELRTEDGWPIFSRMQGHPELPIGTYVLEEDKQAEAHDRKIPDDVRVTVLTRDGFACTYCKWDRTLLNPADPRKFLELHHLVAHANKGKNSEDNLVTLCNVHHDMVHANRLSWTGTAWALGPNP